MDTFDKATRSWVMSRVHSTDTSPEMKVRKALHAAGFRFRLHSAKLPGRPDIVLPKHKVAVFVNGCFWHWHGCKRSRMPQTNRAYWEMKIARTIERDKKIHRLVTEMGWKPWIIWECQLVSDTVALMNDLKRNSVGK